MLEGGSGGLSCDNHQTPDWPSPIGGFGGGGGGCSNGAGGAGGGYNGGNALRNSSGEGGYSYVSSLAIERLTEAEEGQNSGSGSVDILPALSEGCGCEQLCIVLDPLLEEKQCVCPIPAAISGGLATWLPEDNSTKCSGYIVEVGWLGSPHLVGLIAAVVVIILLFSLVCFCLCKFS